jgi:hypothetical protein
MRHQFSAFPIPNSNQSGTGTESGTSIKELRLGSRRKKVSGVRALIAIGLLKKHGVGLAEVARRAGGINRGRI